MSSQDGMVMDASLSAIWAAAPVAPWHFAAVYNGAMSESAKPPGRLRGPALSQGAEASLSLRTLVLIRWVAVAGQAATLLAVHYVFGFVLPLRATLAVVAVSAALNLYAMRGTRAGSRLGDRAAALYLAYDTMQLGILLYLTGGLQNPFAVLMLAPVTVSATILSHRTVIGLSALTVAAISVLAVIHMPLPSRPDLPFGPAPLYVLGMWTAMVSSTLFIAGYNWSVAEGARRMRDAYAATQLALEREQRVSAVGSLAAAAAHQLGSPLATIAVVAKELVRELPKNSPFAEDAHLLLSQSERCRDILADLARSREGGEGEPFARLPFSALVEAAGSPFAKPGIRVVHDTGGERDPGTTAVEEPLVAQSPEVMHGLGNLIQNAIEFARREVAVTTSWDNDTAAVDIVDDGPGFAGSMLARIGEPYISDRAGDGQHMGLGIFIARSLLERTGARLSFANLDGGGAHVVVEWKRSQIEGALMPAPGLMETEA
jgi:two-component system, sensor histidine kinase RegB